MRLPGRLEHRGRAVDVGPHLLQLVGLTNSRLGRQVDHGVDVGLVVPVSRAEIAQVADKIIIGDYLVPKPKGFGSYLSEVIEFIAGAEHYRNYKSYVANGGIYHLANKAGLKIINEITNHPLTNHIVVLAN